MTRAALAGLVLALAVVPACGRTSMPGAPATLPDAGGGGAADDAAVKDAAFPVCAPGSVQGCYDGPAATEGVGPCHGGTQTCKADGSGFGPCTGEVLPKTEDCTTPIDEDCDGHTTCGQLLWTKTFGDGTEATPTPGGSYLGGAHATDVAVDAQGGILVAGYFHGSVDFGNGPLHSGQGLALFVTKLDPAGKALWSRAFPVTKGRVGGVLVAADPHDNVVLSGMFAGSVDFGLGPPASAVGGVYLVELDAGGAGLWERSFSSPCATADNVMNVSLVNGLAVDSQGGMVLCGDVYGSLDFGDSTSGGACSLSSYVAKLDPGGKHVWSHPFNGFCYGVAVAPDDDIVATGTTMSRLDPGGATLWSEDLPSTPDMYLGSATAAVDANGDILGAGTMSYGYGSAEFKLGAQGNTLWAVDDGGGYQESIGGSAAGRMHNLVALGSDEWGDYIEKLSGLDGGTIWRLAPSGDADAYALAITPDNDIVVVGDFTQSDLGGGPLPHVGTASNGFIAEFGP